MLSHFYLQLPASNTRNRKRPFGPFLRSFRLRVNSKSEASLERLCLIHKIELDNGIAPIDYCSVNNPG